MRSSPLRRHVRQRRRHQGAAEAVADGVHALLAGRLLDGVERGVDAFPHVVVEPLLGQARVGVHPGHHEHGVALLHRPAHEGVLGPEVEDVELVDPGREDEERALQHRFRRRRVLDELHQVVLEDDLARRHRDVLADAELGVVRHPDAEPALAALQVVQQVRKALEQVLAAGLGGAPQHLRVGQEEVGRAHRVDELAGVEVHLLRRLLVHAVDVGRHVLEEPGGQEIGLPDEVEHLVLAPRLVLEAAVARVFGDDRLHLLAHHAPRGVLPEGEVVLPEAELRLHHAGGVGHHPGRHLEKSGADIERVGTGGAGAFHRLAPEEVGHDPLAALRDLGHRPGDQRGVRQAELALGGQRRFLIHGSSLARCAAHSNRRRTAAAPPRVHNTRSRRTRFPRPGVA